MYFARKGENIFNIRMVSSYTAMYLQMKLKDPRRAVRQTTEGKTTNNSLMNTVICKVLKIMMPFVLEISFFVKIIFLQLGFRFVPFTL